MRTLILSLLLLSYSALADINNEGIQILECEGESIYTRMSITLDSSMYEDDSGYKNPIDANLHHDFTNIPQMVCTGHVFNNDFSRVRCAGYYSFGEILSEITVTNENRNIIGNWETIHGVASTMNCKLHPQR